MSASTSLSSLPSLHSTSFPHLHLQPVDLPQPLLKRYGDIGADEIWGAGVAGGRLMRVIAEEGHGGEGIIKIPLVAQAATSIGEEDANA